MIISIAHAAEAAAHHEESFFEDPTFWVAVAFCITVIMLVKLAGKAISSALQARRDGIIQKFDNLNKLTSDTETLLKDLKNKKASASKDLEDAIAKAKENSEKLKMESLETLDRHMKEKTAQAEKNFESNLNSALSDIKDKTVLLSVETTKALLKEKLDNKKSKELLNTAIDNIPELLKA
ncbi:MAG: hypothetical protein MJ247_03010 [Alphaproteobacteria bacterium]|nr:hypothetical protein [Alphaproteobacteria bacterium]